MTISEILVLVGIFFWSPWRKQLKICND